MHYALHTYLQGTVIVYLIDYYLGSIVCIMKTTKYTYT